MKINILTLFPEMLAPLQQSMLGRAVENGILEIDVTDIREYTEDKHRRVDDTPYGGGAGMVMQVQPILDAYNAKGYGGEFIYMSPRGEVLSGELAKELSEKEEITILCGHYEGVDQRLLDMLGAREISIGDYVLTGGELPAMVLIDTLARFAPGVLPKEESVMNESIYSGLLEYPQYSRPAVFNDMEVPEVLLSGDHGAVDLWRLEQSLALTKEKRPDLFEKYLASEPNLSKKERAVLEKVLSDSPEQLE
ncbi:MAG: tRNA (guanosine(37)-N1)-methyltransferase TrmD [Mogibacterium sp.]|nr:tRNA (guanosine(37)-N1)-methyltransferase TrmD [Mogibacterium sp.]